MIQHFACYSVNYSGWQLKKYTEAGINKRLKEDEVTKLAYPFPAERLKDPQRIQTVLNGVVALSSVIPAQDNYKRRTFYNHTLVLFEDEYLSLGAHPLVLEDQLRSTDTKPLSVTENFYPSVSTTAISLDMTEEEITQILEALLSSRMFPHIKIAIVNDTPLTLIYALLSLLPISMRIINWATTPLVPSNLTVYKAGRWSKHDTKIEGTSPRFFTALAKNLARCAFTEKDLAEVQARWDNLYFTAKKYGREITVDNGKI